MIYDCIVVGSGPAGASAAYHLADRGFSVLLLEKERLPRYKPCGGLVIDRVAEWFDFDFGPAISVRVSRLRMASTRQGGYSGEFELPRPVWMVHREVFDFFLVQQAQRRGAVVLDQFAVTGIMKEAWGWRVLSGAVYRDCRYLVAADGAKGMMASWLGFTDRMKVSAGALEAEIPAARNPDPVMHLSFSEHLTGYAWNFAKAKSHSIGVGALRRDRVSLRKELDVYCGSFGLSSSQGRVFGHPLLLWDGDQPLHTDHALLTGEAACTVDPWSAEGIRPAMMTGVKAADAVAGALNGFPYALEQYSHTLQEEHGREMNGARLMAARFYSTQGNNERRGSLSPAALALSARLMCGDIGYQKYLMGLAFLRVLSGG